MAMLLGQKFHGGKQHPGRGELLKVQPGMDIAAIKLGLGELLSRPLDTL